MANSDIIYWSDTDNLHSWNGAVNSPSKPTYKVLSPIKLDYHLHVNGYVPNQYTLAPKIVYKQEEPVNYRTQKARGLTALSAIVNDPYHPYLQLVPVHTVLDARKGAKLEGLEWLTYPSFARPCPLTPRHGFVDSRTVNNKEELLQVIEETRAADPEGEVMLMPFINAVYNVVWTPALMSIGEGHDGATVGKNTVSFPLTGKWDSKINAICSKAGVADYPYVEAVIENTNNRFYNKLTQLRNGPELTACVDYIPKQVLVNKIIEPDTSGGDLLKWEALMLEAKGKQGLVVYHPGGSQADHFSIHARSCNIPCITSFKPVIGAILTPTGIEPPSYSAVLKGLVAGANTTIGIKGISNYPFQSEALTMLLGLHCSSAMSGEQAWWIGTAVAIMLRLGSMALRGEARHLDNKGVGRHVVYTSAAKRNLKAHANTCNSLINIFRYGWSYGATGVGGRKWAQCGLAIGDLFNATRDFVEVQTEDTYGAMLRALNVAVNQAHNGGWWMNKFVAKRSFDEAQQGYLSVALEAVPAMWEFAQTYNNLTLEQVKKTRKLWITWRPTKLRPPRITSVSAKRIFHHGWITLSMQDRLLKNRHVPLQVNIADLIRRVPLNWPAEFHIRTAETGLALDVSFPGVIDEPLEVWTEPKLKVQSVT